MQNIEHAEIRFEAEVTASAPPTLARSWASLDALLGQAGVAFVPMPVGPADRMQRATIYPLGYDASPDGKTGRLDIYLVTRGPGEVVLLEDCGQAVATFGTEAAGMGGVSGQVFAKSIAFTTTGRLKAATGGLVEVQKFPASGSESPAGLVLYDTGDAIGYLLAPGLGASGPATSVNVASRRWR